MRCEFGNRHLTELYTKGRSRKYPAAASDRQLLKKFIMRIQQLEAAVSIYDLWKNPGLNFKQLSGTTHCSIRVDNTWRLEFDIAWEDDPPTKGDVTIVELSKHYGD